MKKYLKFILSIFVTAAVISCDKDDDSLGVDLNSIAAPHNLGATFHITQDNTGLVTIIPTGESVTQYSVDFGDGSPIAEEIKVGESVQHAYAEGDYDVVIIGQNLAGETAQGTQSLTVSFRTPENLEVNIARDPQNNYKVNVSASADFAAMFNVYFGESDDEEPTPLMPGESVSHTYATIGTYEVRVVALSGGEATLETSQEITITDPLFLPINFESDKLDYAWIGFGGSGAQVIDNPDMSGLNSSSKVVELTKGAGAQTWAGASLQLDEPLDFSQGTAVKMNVWSPEAGVPVMFKIEDSGSAPDANGNPSVFVEITQNTTTSEEWEEMTFDLSSASSFDRSVNYDRIIVFYDFGNPGEGTTFYFDDIRLAKLELITLPITFESETLNYSFYNFGPDMPNGVPIVDNPDPNSVNSSEKVAKYTKPAGSEVWAGTFLELDEPIDFSTKRYIQVDVWSPTAGTPVLLKVENKVNGNLSAEITAVTTVSEEWETLTFDLNAVDPAIDYDKIVIFFNMNTSGTGETYYFDNIRTTDLTSITLPLNFESERLDFSFFNFGPDVADGVPIVDNPDPNDVNSSSKVAEYTKPAGSQVWAGTFLELDEAIDFSAQTKVSVDVWSPIAGAPINLKIENSVDNSIADEDVVNTTVSGEWETLTFDLSGVDPSQVYDKVVLFFNFNVAGTGETYYFDNIRLTN